MVIILLKYIMGSLSEETGIPEVQLVPKEGPRAASYRSEDLP